MSLTLITGAANSGKTGEVIRRLEDAVAVGMSAVLLLPNTADVARARREIAKRIPAGVLVSGFDRYIRNVWPARGDGRTLVTAGQRQHLLRGCVHRLGQPHGAVRLAERVVQRVAGAAGPGWREIAAHPSAGSFGALLRCYADELGKHGMAEVGEAASILSAGNVLPHDMIAFNRFSDLSPAQTRFITQAVANIDVVVSLTWVPGRAATKAVERLVRVLEPLGQAVCVENEHTPSEELRRVEAHLFEGPSPGDAEGHVEFITAENEEAEWDSIVGAVHRLQLKGCGLEEIAVIYRDLRPHVSGLRRAFAEGALPADFDLPRQLIETSLGQALVSLVQFAVNGDRESLQSFARSPYSGGAPDEVRAVEARWRRSDTVDAEALVRGLRRLGTWQPRLTAAIRSPKGATPREWLELLDRLLASVVTLPSGPFSADADEDFAAHAAAGRAITEVGELGVARLTAAAALAALQSALVPPRHVERAGHVQVMAAERVRGRRFEAVIVGGLNDGEFPRRPDEGLHSLELVGLFSAAGLDDHDYSAGERLLFYEVVTRARRFLVLNRRLGEAAGAPVGPSAFWEEMRDFYRPRGVEEEHERPSGSAAVKDAPALVEHVVLSERRSARRVAELTGRDAGEAFRREGEGVPSAAEPTGPALEPTLGARVATAATRSCGWPDRIVDAGLRADLASRSTFSARAIETYARCPRRWFIEHVLRPEGMDFEFGGLVRGYAVHEALRLTYSLVREKAQETRIERVEPSLLDALLEEAIAGAVGATEVPERHEVALADWVRPRARRSLRSDARFMPAFAPEMFEVRLGGDENEAIDMDGFLLSGVVDRVDTAADGRLLVIDYKSGSGPYKASDWRSALQMQVALYVLALGRWLDRPVVGGFYRTLSDGATRGVCAPGFTPADGIVKNDVVELEPVLEWAIERARSAVKGMREGAIPPAETEDYCAYCAGAAYCRGAS